MGQHGIVPDPLRPHPDRLLPPDPGVRALARRLYEHVRALPIISPHGHVDARVLAEDLPFTDPTTLLLSPDHYVTRLLHASGVPLDALGVGVRRLPEGRNRARRGGCSASTGRSSAGPPCATGWRAS